MFTRTQETTCDSPWVVTRFETPILSFPGDRATNCTGADHVFKRKVADCVCILTHTSNVSLRRILYSRFYFRTLKIMYFCFDFNRKHTSNASVYLTLNKLYTYFHSINTNCFDQDPVTILVIWSD